MLTVKTDETGKVIGIEGASQELYDLVDAARNGALKLRNESKHPIIYKRHDRNIEAFDLLADQVINAMVKSPKS